MSELSVNLSRNINAPIESVYNAWLDPEMLARFMIPGEGVTVPKAEANAQEGGRFDLIMLVGDKELPHGGVYQKLNPYSQIVFTWESHMSIDGSTVTLNFSETTDGTHVELVHIKFRDEEARDNHEGGWTSILKTMEEMFASTVSA